MTIENEYIDVSIYLCIPAPKKTVHYSERRQCQCFCGQVNGWKEEVKQVFPSPNPSTRMLLAAEGGSSLGRWVGLKPDPCNAMSW